MHADRGALIVLGDGPEVLAICSGGFLLDAEFSPQRLAELAKMDGAIILAADCSRIARANVHLVPDHAIPTAETGTRHRTAERVSRLLGVTVLSVSESMSIVTVYQGDQRHYLEMSSRLLNRANYALQTLERYRTRLDTVLSRLTALEVEDLVTSRDVVTVLQRIEIVRRIALEIRGHVVELGTNGNLVSLQLEELMSGVLDSCRLVISDYLPISATWGTEDAVRAMAELDTDRLLDLRQVQAVLHLPAEASDLDSVLRPRGYRLLGKIPRLPDSVVDHLVARFGNIQKILDASVSELDDVEGVGEARAHAVKEGLTRLTEAGLLDRWS